ncbi:MAG TPA: hypothetical protein VGY13_06920 [Solirubrobacteraceae bacterium]|nr:hypothetical protein [Solirubrobacteraceae bacterium]
MAPTNARLRVEVAGGFEQRRYVVGAIEPYRVAPPQESPSRPLELLLELPAKASPEDLRVALA